MDDVPAQRSDFLECLLEIHHREIRQRERISWPATTDVQADHWTLLARLPAFPIALRANLEANAEKLRPEPARAVSIVGRKLDQR